MYKCVCEFSRVLFCRGLWFHVAISLRTWILSFILTSVVFSKLATNSLICKTAVIWRTDATRRTVVLAVTHRLWVIQLCLFVVFWRKKNFFRFYKYKIMILKIMSSVNSVIPESWLRNDVKMDWRHTWRLCSHKTTDNKSSFPIWLIFSFVAMIFMYANATIFLPRWKFFSD